MEKILLINPPQQNTIKAGIEDDFIDIIGYYPPLGLMYLATILNNSGYNCKILDCVPQKINYENLKNEILEYKPFVVGISTYTMSMVDVLLTAQIVKDINPDIKVVLGGHHVYLYPELSIKYKNVDFILQGEADYTFLNLVENLSKNQTIENLKNIDGVGFIDNGEIFINKNIPIINNLDLIPFPDRNLLPFELYQSIVGRNKTLATIMSSRGCPYKCTFCYCPSKLYRTRSTENIIQEVRYLKDLGYREIFFFDDLFAQKAEKVIEFSKALKNSKIEIEWSFRGRINTITEELIKEVASSGIHRIQFGIESGVDKTLKRIKKGITIDQINYVINLCKKYKITTIGNFMIGLPDETEDDIKQTIKFSKKIGLNYAQYSVLVPYPFTEIYNEALDNKIITKDFWLKFSENPLVEKDNFKVEYWTKNVSEDFLFKMIKKSFKSFYFRPKIILQKLFEIKTFQELWFLIKGAFSVFGFNPKSK